ncbi:hypothetical protein N9A22_03995 [Methylophilaceae bacterium]|nr:hypothetical protein [Methylophilaceae bacterium]
MGTALGIIMGIIVLIIYLSDERRKAKEDEVWGKGIYDDDDKK